MLRHLCIFVLLGTHGVARAAESGQLDANVSLFTVMCALHAAGYDAEIDSPNNHPLRAAAVRNLASRNLTTAGELREWLENRKLGPKRLDLNRFISFALSVDGPPKFNYKFASHEMPPDVVPLAGFERLISRFYAEAQVEELYKQAQPAIERTLASYQPAVVQTLSQVNGYLRNPTSGYAGRRFSIIVELLGPPNQIQTRAYRDDYYLILTPSPELQTDYIRYAYLQYLLDPLSFKFAAKLDKKKPLIDLAQAAPALEEHYKTDFSLLDDAETLYRAAKLEPSRDLFLRALQETADQPLHAKAYYGLGRVAARQANLELAEKMFTKVLDLSPDPQTKAWTHVYLGNLAERAQEPQQAQAQFAAALAIPGATAAARQAAQQALNKLVNTPKEKQ